MLPFAMLALAALCPGSAVAAPQSEVRVGVLVGVAQVRIDAPGSPLLLSEGSDGPGRRREGPLLFGARGSARTVQPAAAVRSHWDVRATVEATKKRADIVRAALDEALRAPLRVERTGAGFAVLAGPFDEEARARSVLSELQQAGMHEAQLVRPDAAPAAQASHPHPGASRLVAVTGAWEVVPIASERARIATADGTPIEVDGKGYRGALEVIVSDSGLLTVVNVVGLEDYMRGVVPSELGPEAYPSVEALKAQAIAARTYALMPPAHEREGFERCAGPHCQVYRGVSAEHPVSDRAVRETESQVVIHEGLPIHAYFSSTCGGHTEDVANVFSDEPSPYLRGVPCYPEKVEFLRIPGRQITVDFNRVDGRTAHGVLARLIAAGVVNEEEIRQGIFSRRARGDESANWLARAASAAGRTLDRQPTALNVDTAIGFLRSVLSATGAISQARLIESQDLVAAARFREFQGLAGDDLQTALLALKGGLLPEGLEPGWGASKLSRGNVLELLEGWLRSQGLLNPPPVRFLGSSGGMLRVLSGTELQSVGIGPGLLVLSGRPNAPQRMREALELKMGDRLRLHRDAEGLVRCIELDEDPDGASLDRTSSYSWWTRRVAFAQLADSAAALGFGRLRDVQVTRISAAGRVVGLTLLGEGGDTRELSGFAVRQFLGLPDSRCEVHLDRDHSGALVAVTATGRGWGHGVGLCQVGAHGMALMGRSAAEILAHYYPGTKVAGLSEIGSP